MTDAHTLLTVAMLVGYGLISGLTSAFGAVYLIRRHDARAEASKPKSVTPHAVNPTRPRPAPPLPVVYQYQEVTRLPVLDGDVTEVRDDKNRLDLLKHHTEWGPRSRGDRAS